MVNVLYCSILYYLFDIYVIVFVAVSTELIN